MMGGFDEHIRQFNNYNTIFGSFWFNILCVSMNLAQIVTSVVLIGYYHSLVTIDYIWWPVIEMIRLFILTILRFDVMLKGVENYNDNRTGFKYTKRMIVLCNLIGFFVILIGAPIYFALLSTASNSLYSMAQIYTIFMAVYPCFILVRICLTLPMYCTLLLGTNPIFSLNHAYQRIDDGIATHHRRRSRRHSQRDGYDNEERESHDDRVQRQIRRQWRVMQLEQRQMELAIEQSRRDAFRSTVKEQDKEYERALAEAKQPEIEPINATKPTNPTMNNESANVSFLSSNPITSASDTMPLSDMTPAQSAHLTSDDLLNGIGTGLMSDECVNNAYLCSDDIELDPLPAESEDKGKGECVYIRIRLPNGIRSQRRFHHSSTVGDIVLWTQWECKKHRQIHLINHSQLISTMPHTVYSDMTKNMKELNFWRANAKRKLVSPLLYIEEL